jgi:hypothetical protein
MFNNQFNNQFNTQFRPPMFPNNFGGMSPMGGFNPGMNGFNNGSPYGFNQSFNGNTSPMSYMPGQQDATPSNRQETSVAPTSNDLNKSQMRRVQQGPMQHHVQQVPVFRTVQVRERIIEIPQVHVVKEFVPKIEVIERVREVPKVEVQVVEKIVEIPQIQYVDKYVDKVETREIERYVPKIEIVEVPREVPKIDIQVVEKIVEVPQIQYIDRIVEVPQVKEVIRHVPKIEIVDVPIKREVRVPKIEVRQVEEIKEVFIPEIIEVPVEKEVRVNVPVPQIQRIERPVPGPVNFVDVEVEVRVPKQVQVPHYIDVPVPREVIKEVPVPRQVPKYKDVEVPVEVEQIVTVPIERKVPVPRTVYKHVEEIKKVEVPYEVTIPEEVEEIVEIIQNIQPVIEPVVHTRYEQLPPIREQGKPVYVNGPPTSRSLSGQYQQQQQQQSQMVSSMPTTVPTPSMPNVPLQLPIGNNSSLSPIMAPPSTTMSASPMMTHPPPFLNFQTQATPMMTSAYMPPTGGFFGGQRPPLYGGYQAPSPNRFMMPPANQPPNPQMGGSLTPQSPAKLVQAFAAVPESFMVPSPVREIPITIESHQPLAATSINLTVPPAVMVAPVRAPSMLDDQAPNSLIDESDVEATRLNASEEMNFETEDKENLITNELPPVSPIKMVPALVSPIKQMSSGVSPTKQPQQTIEEPQESYPVETAEVAEKIDAIEQNESAISAQPEVTPIAGN